MEKWVRPLHREPTASSQWHAARQQDFTTATYCDETLEGPIEVTTSRDHVTRDGQCSTCATRLHEKQELSAATRR